MVNQEIQEEQSKVTNLIDTFVDNLKDALNLENYRIRITIDPHNLKKLDEEPLSIARGMTPTATLYFYDGNIATTDKNKGLL